MLSESFLSRLDAMSLSIRKSARGGSGGLRRSKALGGSVEFSDFREYAPGDDLRRIDWNAYARFDRLFLKLFMEEQEARVNIVVDGSASMAFGEPSKWDAAGSLAEILAYLATRGGDRVTVCTIPGGSTRPLSGRSGFRDADAFLRRVVPAGEARLSRDVPRVQLPGGRGMTVLISDLMSEDGYEKALSSLLYRDQEVILLQVLSPWEMAPDLEGAVELVSMEGGRMELLANREALLSYDRALKSLTGGAESYCRSHGIGYRLIRSDMDFEREALRELSAAGLVG